ncbi:MAG: hypothetical protein VX324_12125, partial [Pseudomonadota bacterium]|nr:hypothetical protein [Pseudomonadota bacterium]
LVARQALLFLARRRGIVVVLNFYLKHTAGGPAVEQVVQAFGDAGQLLTARMIDWLSGCDYPPAPETARARQP